MAKNQEVDTSVTESADATDSSVITLNVFSVTLEDNVVTADDGSQSLVDGANAFDCKFKSQAEREVETANKWLDLAGVEQRFTYVKVKRTFKAVA